MKKLAKILLAILALLIIAFVIFRTPDTDPAEMRAKYGGEPSQFVELDDGLTVHLRDEGPRDAPVIMLLHGSSSDLHTWEPWAAALKDDYRIVRYDQIGHGLTGPSVDGNYALSDFTATVGAVADKLGIDQFILGGSSMGGWISAGYALEHPERLSGLILVGSSGAPIRRDSGGGNIGFTIAATPGLNEIMKHITPRNLVEESYRQSVFNEGIVTPEGIDRYWELLRYPGNRAATIARFNTPRVAYTKEKMASVTIPTLLIWGKEDALVPFAAAAWYEGALPDAQLVALENIGHLPMEEAPDETVAALRTWLTAEELTNSAGN